MYKETISEYPLIAGSRPRLGPYNQIRPAGAGLFLCGYCGQEMIEISMYKGGRGYDWAKICPDKCHPDKYDKQLILEV